MQKRPYPHEIKKEWRDAIDLLELSTDEKKQIMHIVAYAQPPLSIPSLIEANDRHCLDKGAYDITPLITKISDTGDIPRALPKNIGTNFPIYYALTHPDQLNKKSSKIENQSRLFLSRFFKKVALDGLVSRGNFYNHVLAVRDILKTVVYADLDDHPDSDTFGNYILTSINSDTFYSQRTNLRAKINVFKLLVNGKLRPGEKTRDHHGGGKGTGGQGTGIKNDPWHDKRIQHLATAPRPPRKRVREQQSSNTQNFDADVVPDSHEVGMQLSTAKNRAEVVEEVTETMTLQRDMPSTLTPADDRQLTRRFTRSAPTSTLAAVSDISRLTPEQVWSVLHDAPLDPLTRAYAVLVLSLGLPPSRLNRLVVSDHFDTVINNSIDARPHWCPTHGILCYRLLDGPSLDNANPTSLWVQMRLPDSLANALNEHVMNQSDQRLFRGIRGELNKQLRRFFRKSPGIIPTANRLQASSWLYRRPSAVDDIAAATLSGQFGLSGSAPAAYRQLPRTEIQHLLTDTLATLGITESQGIHYVDGVNTFSPTDNSPLGSSVAKPPNAFVPIFQALRDAMNSSQATVSGWWAGKPFPLDALATLHQLVSAHELLAWQLSAGARPIGNSSANRMGNQSQWIHDKNSARGIESRVIPLLKVTRDSLRSLHQWTDNLTRTASSAGVVISDRRTAVRETPSWLCTTKKPHQLVLRDMTWSDLLTLDLPYLRDWPNNVPRHSLATWLRQHLPDAEIDALLGHARHGRMLSSPRAEASIGQQPRLRRALKEWLSECGYQSIKWEGLAWHF